MELFDSEIFLHSNYLNLKVISYFPTIISYLSAKPHPIVVTIIIASSIKEFI